MRDSGHMFTGGEVGKFVLFSIVLAYLGEVVDSLGWHIGSGPFLFLTFFAYQIACTFPNSFCLSFLVCPLPNFLVFIFLVL